MNVRMTISISPELQSALTRLSLNADTNISKELEFSLRENPRIAKIINEIREESDSGALAGSRARSHKQKNVIRVSSSA